MGKEEYEGEVPIFPSFTPDLEKLDEEGIRFDVSHIYANGFTSVMAAPEVCGMTFEERKQFVQIVCDEAKGKMHSSVSVMQDSALLLPPQGFPFRTQTCVAHMA